jgi:hypothetical protein
VFQGDDWTACDPQGNPVAGSERRIVLDDQNGVSLAGGATIPSLREFVPSQKLKRSQARRWSKKSGVPGAVLIRCTAARSRPAADFDARSGPAERVNQL